MNIDFELYRIFYVVAKCHSITEAAQKLSISQPAITKSIKSLENQLSGTLFIRSKQGIHLTEEGKCFYNYIRPAIDQIYTAENQFTNIKRLDIGDITIGTSNTILRYFLMPYLKKYSLQYPKINISIEESYTPDIINMVKNGAVDVAVIYAAENDHKLDGLRVYNLKHLHYCLIGNEKYKNLTNEIVDFKSINPENLIMNTINPIQNGLAPDRRGRKHAHVNLASHSLVYEFVKEGFGIGVAIREFIIEDLNNGKLFEIKITDDFEPLNLVLITKSNDFPNYAVTELINTIKERLVY